jgi:hypothetical protein
VKKLLVVAFLVLGCGGKDNTARSNPMATAASAPRTEATPVPVQMVFEGLIAFEQVDKAAPEKGMYALMVDATKADLGANPPRPPCAKGALSDYPDHTTAIYVEGAKLSLSVNGGAPTNPGNLVKIEDEDIKIAVDPPSPYFSTPESLTKLIDEKELYWASQNANNGKIVVDRGVYLDPDELAPKKLANLAGRILIDSGVAEARANTCAATPEKQILFGFKEVGQDDATFCKSPHLKFPVELSEEVLVSVKAAKAITLTMVTDPGTGRRERKLVIEPDGTSKPIRISFRNVMEGFQDKPEAVLCGAPRHLATYQWFYNLTKDPKAGSGCTWIPCVHPDTGHAGGGKCPNPGLGG